MHVSRCVVFVHQRAVDHFLFHANRRHVMNGHGSAGHLSAFDHCETAAPQKGVGHQPFHERIGRLPFIGLT